MAIEMMAVPYGGEACAVVLGRSGGPVFRRSELLRLAHLTGIASTVATLAPPLTVQLTGLAPRRRA